MNERPQKIVGVVDTIEARVVDIMERFEPYTHGVRVLIMLHRTKDGGHNKEFHRRLEVDISNNSEQFKSILTKMVTLQLLFYPQVRIYSTANSRSLKKAEHKFKLDMLNADFTSQENHEIWWERFDHRWVSALMSPGSRTSSYFIIDVDDKEGEDRLGQALVALSPLTKLLMQYRTKNGWHIVTEPFNPNLFTMEGVEIKKDGQLLLAH